MDPSWLETAGRVSLYIYFAIVVGCLIALVLRKAVRPLVGAPAPGSGAALGPPARRLARILVEYFGNAGPPDDRHAPAAEPPDRRVNLQARFLMDYIREEMTRGDVTSTEREELIQGLREAMRSSDRQGQHG